MELSVVIPTMNKVSLLKQTLTALEAQELRPGVAWEVVVVNDGSTDGTGAFLDSFAANFKVPMVVVTPPGNVGRARARNQGARAAQGDWIVFLDDDIVAPPGLLLAHLELLEDFVQCDARFVEGYPRAVCRPASPQAPRED